MRPAARGAGSTAGDTRAPVSSKSVPILVVNDNADQRMALIAVLAPLGYLIVEADSGVEALRRVAERDFAVILLDVYMPEMNGFETAAFLRQRRQSEMTPIIFITAYGSDELATTDLYAQGAVDFIFAPVPADELRSKVSVFVNLFTKAERLAEQAREVQEAADQLRLLNDIAPIGIFRTDANNCFVYTNARWSEITGITANEAAGKMLGTLIPAKTGATLIAEADNRETRLGEVHHRVEIRTPGLPPRIVLLTSRAVSDNGGAAHGWVGTLADITSEVGAEAAMAEARDQATQASRLKSDFLANMSHEIRTPMNGVIGMTDLLLETDLDTHQRDYAQTVRNSGEALLTIIDDILDFSKVEAGMLEIEDIELDVRSIVNGVVDLMAGTAQTKGLELVAVVERSVPGVVHGDPGRVRQVLTNLIGNAIKFTQAGEIVVRVTQAEIATETVVRFEVSDTGDGIAPEKLDLVFEPFVQADTSTSRKYGGTGLGLSISSHLVSLMGGECGVSSRLDEGSTFWFAIPFPAAYVTTLDRLDPDADLDGVSALVVDDNATQRRVLSQYLSDWGMAVTTVDSAEAALMELRSAVDREEPFAVAVLDRSMPGMDGLELKNTIASDPDLTTALVLMLNLGQSREFGPAGESGVSAWLSKPVHAEDLRTCVRVALALQPPEPVTVETSSAGSAGAEPGARLLVAEDNLTNQKVAVAMLSGAGYRVDTVLDGAAAVAASAAETYDAILMDCQMPEMNGYDATVAIRAREGAGQHTPIIAMTAGARREDQERSRIAGMDSYLAKPVSKDALLAQVAQSVKHGRSLRAALTRSPHASADEITIDPVVFDELRILGEASGQDFVASLVEQFADDTEPLLEQLRTALEADDAPTVGLIAHSIKGSCGQLGGRRLASSCGRLEAKAAAGSLADGKRDLQDIEVDYQALRGAWAEQLDAKSDRRTLHA